MIERFPQVWYYGPIDLLRNKYLRCNLQLRLQNHKNTSDYPLGSPQYFFDFSLEIAAFHI